MVLNIFIIHLCSFSAIDNTRFGRGILRTSSGLDCICTLSEFRNVDGKFSFRVLKIISAKININQEWFNF